RRRHTRSTRDWSSDVCSSDLLPLLMYLLVTLPCINRVSPSGLCRRISHVSLWSMPSSPIQFVIAWLSQEQRWTVVVGPGCPNFQIGRASCRERVVSRGGGGSV